LDIGIFYLVIPDARQRDPESSTKIALDSGFASLALGAPE
jgi:hypothetical protein